MSALLVAAVVPPSGHAVGAIDPLGQYEPFGQISHVSPFNQYPALHVIDVIEQVGVFPIHVSSPQFFVPFAVSLPYAHVAFSGQVGCMHSRSHVV